jgi:uncharacterized phiE125 gp8 family phage protein
MTTSGWKLKLVTPPSVEPVSLEEAKGHLRVTITDDDAEITRYIKAAREAAESFTRRAFVTQTWELGMYSLGPTIELPKPPLISVVGITYTDQDGAEQTLPTTDYVVDDYSEPGLIYRARAASWPALTSESGVRVKVRFTVGYRGEGSPGKGAENVPEMVKVAILLHVGEMYENRQTATAMPAACETLLHPFRVYGWDD